MAEFKLGRIRFVWKDEWLNGTVYYVDDVVRNGGKTYICQVGHTSAADFYTDLDYSPTKWNQLTDGQEWRGDWTTGTVYKQNDVVKYGGVVYICNDPHTSAATTASGLEADQAKWDVFAESIDWKSAWTINTRYKVNDLIKYGGYTYVCNTAHTSAATTTLGLEADQAKWDEFNQGLEYKGPWSGSFVVYKINDIVKQGAGLWICTQKHTSTASFIADSATYWSQFVEGLEFENAWSSVTTYEPGDVVRYGGNQYIAKTNHFNAVPSTSTTNWDLFQEGIKFQSDWTNATSYKIGEVVRYGGHSYLATADSSAATYTVTAVTASNDQFTIADTTGIVVGMTVRFTGTTFGNVFTTARYYVKTVAASNITVSTTPSGTTFNITADAAGTMTATVSAEPPNAAYWSRLNAGISWQGNWSDDTEYRIGDAVRFGSNAYICVLAHRSEADDGSTVGAAGGGQANSRPDQDTAGIYWNPLSIGTETSILTTRGDLVYYGGSGPTRLPIGLEGQVLRAGADDPEWVTLGATDQVYYVAPHGVDAPAPVQGKSLDKPFKTIRYACEQVEKGPRNPNAQHLLELNRVFIQREVSSWIDYQVDNATIGSIWYNFDFDEYKCERDVGFVVDRLQWDIGHGGNLKIRAAAQSLLGILSEGPFSTEEEDAPYATLSSEREQGIAAYNYMLTVVEAVLDNQAPTVIYQNVTDDSVTIAEQYVNTDLVAESTAMTDITGLVNIITNALANPTQTGALPTIPARYVPFTLVSVATGRYRETLPIVVPAYTCIQGDELRSTNAGPAGSLVDISDSYYTIDTFDHFSSIVEDIITGAAATVTTGNIETQSQEWPFADSAEVTAVTGLVEVMKQQADHRLSTMHVATLTDPVGYNVGYLAGYGDARKLIKENKRFLQEEVVSYINTTYSQLEVVGSISVDVLTVTSVVSGVVTVNSVIRGQNVVTGTVIDEQLSGTIGGAGTYRVNTVQTVGSTTIKADTHYSRTKTRRDAGYIIDAVIYDLTYGGNAQSVSAGLAYFDGDNADSTVAAALIPASIKSATLGTIAFLKSRMQSVATAASFTPLQNTIPLYTDTAGSAGASTLIGNNVDAIIEIIDTGPGAVGTTVTLTDPATTNGVSSTTALISAYSTLNSATPTIIEGTIDFINQNYGSFKYNSELCRRDSEYLVDAAYYDAAFGSNFWAVQNGLSYRRPQAGIVLSQQLEQEIGAINYIKTQVATSLASNSTAVTRANATYVEIIDIITNGVASADALVYTDTGTANFTNARAQLVTNRAFIISEMVTWMTANTTAYPALSAADKLICQRDLGYTIDALAYDVNYGGNTATRNVCRSLFNNITGVLVQPSGQQADSAASYTQLGAICAQIVVETYAGQDTGGTAASATEATRMTTLAGNIASVVTAGSLSGLVAESLPSITWAAGGIQTAVGTLASNKTTIVEDTLQFITDTYNTFVYDQEKCSRDVGTILKAVGYDFMLGNAASIDTFTNYQSLKAAHSYLRPNASDVYTLGQKTVTIAALEYARTQAIANVGGNASAIARINVLMALINNIIYGATNEGDVCSTDLRNRDYAILQLERNRAFIAAEVSAYIADTFSDTATNTAATTNLITISDTSWLRRGVSIKFTGTTFGGIVSGTTYYVQSIVNATTFKISATRTGAAFTLSTASGSMAVELVYNQALCLRDVGTYIDALKWDLKYTSNYKSRFVARYYANAVLGSQEEDMYYLRDGCGLRDQTLADLNGDLLPPNQYSTSRVSAGAYASLDPGWGPDDFRTWIITRSPYIQGLTTFGNAAIGQKIDGALHNGGNDSMVSNDFTQVISDGIGAWVANNGRAELVSVFTYYSHIGYLSTEGGRIRGTNGNNSYGDFGSVAEGFDSTETPNTGVVDNKFQFVATVGNVTTDGGGFLGLEFENAGVDYTEAEFTLTGGGINAAAEANEIRDDAVYQVRLLQLAADGSDGEYGGQGYVTNSNTAQGGGASSITLAATDSETSTAYIGMKVVITGGAGVGQFAIITTYNSGTKLAGVVQESTGSAGWDHFVAGTAIVSPDASSTYTVEPRLTFTAPTYASAAGTGLPTAGNYTAIGYASAVQTYLAVATTTSGSGTGATFNVIKKGTKYIITVAAGGTGYTRLGVLTIAGTSLGGASTTNDITLTITSINSVNGAVTAVDHVGVAQGGNYVALLSGASTAVTSIGSTWSTQTLPVSRNWTALAAGQDLTAIAASALVANTAYKVVSLGDSLFSAVGAESNFVGQTFIATGPTSGSGTVVSVNSVMVAIATGSNSTIRSTNGGITWSNGGNLPSSTTWVSVAYGNGRWVAVATGGTANAYSTDGGQTWASGAALPASTTWTGVAYGGGKFVAVASGGTQAASSTDGGLTWGSRTLPSSSNWSSVAFGNNRFVAVSSTSGTAAAYSLNGVDWTASTITSAAYLSIAYGQGTFFAVGASTTAASSPDGVVWTSRTISTSDSSGIAFGNVNRTGKFVTISNTGATNASVITAGTTTRARASVANGKIFAVRVLEPGSSYASAPTMTITDPNNTYEAPFTVRTGDGVLANPNFTNRGTQYETASAEILRGDGFADNFQTGSFIACRRLQSRPVPGANVVFSNLPERTFKLVNIITFRGSLDGSYTGFLQVSPSLTISESPNHLDSASLRLRYSQVRLTGHDFLDIGTGSFVESNYPGTPLQEPIPANETVDNNGGRVFFTATDQDGNFRVGDLFAIEQSTGIATLNADAFNISGLQELNLGNVTLGGGSATVTEFSTDPFFTADSDNIVPTQRAIKAFIASQIGGGGASLNVNSVTAGSVFISSNVITTVTGTPITMNATFEFRGGVTGYPLAFNFFLN